MSVHSFPPFPVFLFVFHKRCNLVRWDFSSIEGLLSWKWEWLVLVEVDCLLLAVLKKPLAFRVFVCMQSDLVKVERWSVAKFVNRQF